VTDTVLARVAALKTTPTLTLKGQWRELFGKEPPVGRLGLAAVSGTAYGPLALLL
jgi:hypothetical protein